MSGYTGQQAYRAFDRIMLPKVMAASRQADLDAAFDAGEFSAGFHDRSLSDEHEITMIRVAERMGVTVRDIHEAMAKAMDKHFHACADKGIPCPF